MKIEYRKLDGKDKISMIRRAGEEVKYVGVIMPDRNGNVGVKFAAFLIMSPDQVAELNRQVGSLDREVRRKRDNPLKTPF